MVINNDETSPAVELMKSELVYKAVAPFFVNSSLYIDKTRSEIQDIVTRYPDDVWPEKLCEYIKAHLPLPKKDELQLSAIIELVKKFFPTSYNSGTEQDIKGIFMGTGYDEWPGSLYDYIMQYGTFDKAEVQESFTMTFQEVSELMSLLPPRAPKELNVVINRNDDGELQLEFVGKINVPYTSGRKKAE